RQDENVFRAGLEIYWKVIRNESVIRRQTRIRRLPIHCLDRSESAVSYRQAADLNGTSRIFGGNKQLFSISGPSKGINEFAGTPRMIQRTHLCASRGVHWLDSNLGSIFFLVVPTVSDKPRVRRKHGPQRIIARRFPASSVGDDAILSCHDVMDAEIT